MESLDVRRKLES